MSKLDRDAPILITGSSGMLGSAVVAYLRQTGFTRLLTPTRQEMNLLDYKSTQAYLSKYQPHSIIHLASIVFGLGGNLDHQMFSLLKNTTINNNIFTWLQEHPVERFFFAGTVASYSYPYFSLPLKEENFFDGLPHYGEFGYAMAKRHAYSYLKILSQETIMKFTYGIFTNLYGKNDNFDIKNGHVIPSLIAKAYSAAKSNTSLEVWGDGSAVRDFLHVEDAAQAILICLDQNDENRLINISSGYGISIRNIAEIIASAAQVQELHFSAAKPTGILKRIVSNNQLTMLGFNQLIPIEEGLRNTYEWYRIMKGK